MQQSSSSNMIIFDEVHLVSDTATTLRKVLTSAYPKKPLLGLTARYNTILSLLPPVRRYIIGDAVKDKRLARPVVIPIKVDLTHDEKKTWMVASKMYPIAATPRIHSAWISRSCGRVVWSIGNHPVRTV